MDLILDPFCVLADDAQRDPERHAVSACKIPSLPLVTSNTPIFDNGPRLHLR